MTGPAKPGENSGIRATQGTTDSTTEYVNEIQGTPYNLVKMVGAGSFGSVFLAKNGTTEAKVAIKFLERTKVSKYVEGEIVNHSLLRHPHVIQFHEVFLTQEHVCIVMEYANHGSLFEYVKLHGFLKQSLARWFFQQLILGLDYCHKRGVANRDIKLENLLLNLPDGIQLPILKISDFGQSKADFMSAAKTKVGTLSYMAPEVATSGKDYDAKSADVWSCGVVLYVMLFGQYPFEEESKRGRMMSIFQRMDAGLLNIPAGVECSDECLDILQSMLCPEPTKRITVDGIFAHPWFIQNLPSKALSFNEHYLKMPVASHFQRPQEVQMLLSKGRVVVNDKKQQKLTKTSVVL